ncbi:MAG: hypothetical protein H5T36_03105 [Methanobacteriaceae archaeon]|nr:hypothetical protein [Methanobacteriaceae archaeon]
MDIDPIPVDSEEDILEAGSKAEIVIVDVPKPTLNKIKTIKNLEKRSNLPIILVTETLSKDIDFGIKAAAHLQKPVDPQKLINA